MKICAFLRLDNETRKKTVEKKNRIQFDRQEMDNITNDQSAVRMMMMMIYWATREEMGMALYLHVLHARALVW